MTATGAVVILAPLLFASLWLLDLTLRRIATALETIARNLEKDHL